MRKAIWLTAVLAALGAFAVPVNAIEGLGETTVSTLFTGGTVQSEIGWTDLDVSFLGVPWGAGGEVAANAAGDVYLLVGGFVDNPNDPQPMKTGLVLYDGTDFTLLAEFEQKQGSGLQTGKLMRKVAVSPATAGLVDAGDPVVLYHHTVDVGGTPEYSVGLVCVDPASKAQTLLYSFGTEAADAMVVIDADGTIYVGPMSDGSIQELVYSSGAYATSEVSPGFDAGEGLAIDSDGYLYTFAQGAYWHGTSSGDRTIYRMEPSSGAMSNFGLVDGDVIIWDWAWSGKLWIAGRGPKPQGKKERKHFVAEAPAGGTAGLETAITQSANDPHTLAASSDGGLLVLESPVTLADYAVHEVSPGSSGGDEGPPKKPKK